MARCSRKNTPPLSGLEEIMLGRSQRHRFQRRRADAIDETVETPLGDCAEYLQALSEAEYV